MKYNELNEIFREYSESPEKSALLLDGEWGSGKTFFVQNVTKKYFEEEGQNTSSERPRLRLVYCSLNGLRNVDDLFQRLAVAVTVTKLAGSKKKSVKNLPQIEGVFKEISKLPVVGKYVPLGFFSFLTQWILENTKGIIVFLDDLERVNPDFRLELIGTIHSLFVEEKGMKVVYLCDESRINDAKYTEAKEKYITRTFRFQSDISLIYDQFFLASDSSLKHSLGLLQAKRDFILNEASTLEIKNLRTLMFIVYQIEKLICLSKEAEKFLSNDSNLSSLISTCLLYKDGIIKSAGDLERITNQYYQSLMLRHSSKTTNNAPESDYEIIQKKYGRNMLAREVPVAIIKLITEGFITATELEDNIRKLSGTDRQPHERALENVRNFRLLSDDDFQRDLVILIKAAKKGLYSPLEYLHITQSLEWFKSLGIIKGTGLETYLTKGLEISLRNDRQEISHKPEAYIDSDRYAFANSSPLALQFKNRILEVWRTKHRFWHEKVAQELIMKLSDGYKALTFARDGFQGAPVFSAYTTDIYCKALPKLATAQIYDFCTIISDRFLRSANAGEHYSEAIPYLEAFREATTREVAVAGRFRKAALQALDEELGNVITHLRATARVQ